MKLLCYTAKDASPAERYILEFILNSQGFFFTWTDHPATVERGDVLIAYAEELPEVHADTTVIRIPRRIESGTRTAVEQDWTIVTVGDQNIPVITSTIAPAKNDGVSGYPYDSIANIFYHLSRSEEQMCNQPEDIDVQLSNAVLYKHGGFMQPVVDILCRDLGSFIENTVTALSRFQIRKAPYPNGEDFGVALTHDVDIVRAYHPVKKTFLKLLVILGLNKNRSCSDMDEQDQTRWAFDRLIQEYRQKGGRATFFFIARYMEQRHFRYRIFSRRFRRLFEALKAEGHEIGLHPSRFAFDYPERYQKEVRRLRKAAGTEICGMRHHYLRCLFPQMWKTAVGLNLRYDATPGYRRHHGFRSGTTGPHRALDYSDMSTLDLTIFPLLFFEESLPGMGRDTVEAMNAIEALITRVKEFHGLLTVLWHPGNLYQGDSFEAIWQQLRSRIGTERVYLATLIDHLRWINFRDNLQLNAIKQSEGQVSITLHCPLPGQVFSLVLSQRPVSLHAENAGYEWIDEHTVQIRPEPGADSIVIHFQVV